MKTFKDILLEKENITKKNFQYFDDDKKLILTIKGVAKNYRWSKKIEKSKIKNEISNVLKKLKNIDIGNIYSIDDIGEIQDIMYDLKWLWMIK